MWLPIFGFLRDREADTSSQAPARFTCLCPPQTLPVRSSEALLLGRRDQVHRIEELAATPRSHFERYYLTALSRFAALVQELPASAAHHHAQAGGLLDHTLDVVVIALKLRQAHLLPPGAAPEDIAHQQDLWTYAVFAAALLHDAAKPAVDQSVTAFDADGQESWRWDPWAGNLTDDGRAHGYRTEFVRKRQYRLHEKASLLLAPRILPAQGIAWLASDRELFAMWLACVGGDGVQAGVLGEIVGKADGESVARNLGAEPGHRAAPNPVIPLHEKLITALRHLIDKGELPLNRNGGAGWRDGEDLWMVSKRTVDALRLHLTESGHVGIPTQNDRLFDVLQEHGILTPNQGRAIWRAEVKGDGWAHELTLIRFPLSRIWSSLDSWPDEFAGEVTPQTTVSAEAKTQSKTENAKTASLAAAPAVAVSPSTAGAFAENDMIQPLREGATRLGGASSPAPSSKASLAKRQDLPGERFLTWLVEGLASQAIAYNHPHARVHVVPEGVILVSPGVFQDFVKDQAIEDSWESVQRKFFRLKRHERTSGGLNVHRYAVIGDNRQGSVNGVLIPDVACIFQDRRPPPNPHLKRNAGIGSP